MIIRSNNAEELILVPQTEHSKLVGQIAANWGNETFSAPTPYASVVRAATYHDFGWLQYESAPLFNATAGTTLHYLDIPNTRDQLEAHRTWSDWLTRVDTYSGLLVRMHRTGLWQSRYDVIDHPKGYLQPQSRKMPREADVSAFIQANEADQSAQRERFNADQVWVNYRLLQVWDLLGLYFSCHEPDNLQIRPVPRSYDDEGTGVSLNISPSGRREVRFDPFPFSRHGCRISLGAKRLDRSSFNNEETFQRAFYQAPFESIEFTLV
jgi:hypothetical protein